MNVFYENFGLRPFQVEKNKIIYGEKIEGGKIFIVSHTIFLESMNQRLEKTDKDMLCREA